MATTTEKEITVTSGLGNADPSQVMAGATFSSEGGFNQEGTLKFSADKVPYDNSVSKLDATNVQEAIDSLSNGSSLIDKTTTFNADGSITETTEAYTNTTVFNVDGSITETKVFADETTITKTTTFNEDGSITEVFE